MSNQDQIIIRTINSVVGHLVAECNLTKGETLIRSPLHGFNPVASVSSVDKPAVLQAIRRVAQYLKMQKSLDILGIQLLNDALPTAPGSTKSAQSAQSRNAQASAQASGWGAEDEVIDISEEAETKAPPRNSNTVKIPLTPGGVPAIAKGAPISKKVAPKVEEKKKTVIIKKAKKPGKEYGW